LGLTQHTPFNHNANKKDQRNTKKNQADPAIIRSKGLLLRGIKFLLHVFALHLVEFQRCDVALEKVLSTLSL
jgi:hypothetical protein